LIGGDLLLMRYTASDHRSTKNH